MHYQGNILMMKSEYSGVVHYCLPVGDELIDMNELIGKEIELLYLDQINCIRCGKKTKTSFAQGYCYPCFLNAPETSECVLRPELCRAHEGISRDMQWSQNHCLQDHIVYLSLTSGLKVGVTRISQIPARWIDQGAEKAIRICRTPNRFIAGTIELALKDYMDDKTNWRKMLTSGCPEDIDLVEEKGRAEELLPMDLQEYISDDDEIFELNYPVEDYPEKVKSIGFDKTHYMRETLTGIKGQYLIFDDGIVLNIRKHGGYLISIAD
ncbi:MAG: DUF2797 domain-containing protein [Bacteroidales bacterium]|nr:DUF2797 domain-containing protein [Bacteroidales bacterium]